LKKCKICRLPADEWKIPPRNSLARTCSLSCALDDVGREKDKQFKQETRSMKVKLLDNDSKFWKAKAQKVFNEFIRLRDSHLGCVSCDKPSSWDGQWHASHWKSRGARPDLAFNEDNVHKSCSVCNNFKSGNVGDYEVRLIEKIGLCRVNALRLQSFDKPLMVDDYKAIYNKYRLETKQLRRLHESNNA